MECKNVVIVGMGAVGILLGDYFTRALGQERVRFLADEARRVRYQRDGVYCNGEKTAFCFSDGTDGMADLVIFAVKANQLAAAVAEAAPCVGPDTILMSILNGVTSEEYIGAQLGEEKVIDTVAQGMDAVKKGNHLTYHMPGQLCIGIRPEEPEKQEKLEAVAALLEKVGFPYQVEEDILHRMWSKFMLNVGVNQVCMVYQTNYGEIQQPGEARETMLKAMDEARKVAVCRGVLVTQQDREAYMAMLDRLPPEGIPSMRQDALAHRPSEVDLFAGTVLQIAERYGMRAPVNQWLFDQIHSMEAAYPTTP